LTLLLVTRVAVYDACQREVLAISLILQADLYAQLVNGSAPLPQGWDFW
jgi:hypothetical protein